MTLADWWAGYLWGLATLPAMVVVGWAVFWGLILIATFERPR